MWLLTLAVGHQSFSATLAEGLTCTRRVAHEVESFQRSIDWRRSQWVCVHVRRTDLKVWKVGRLLVCSACLAMHCKHLIGDCLLQHQLALLHCSSYLWTLKQQSPALISLSVNRLKLCAQSRRVRASVLTEACLQVEGWPSVTSLIPLDAYKDILHLLLNLTRGDRETRVFLATDDTTADANIRSSFAQGVQLLLMTPFTGQWPSRKLPVREKCCYPFLCQLRPCSAPRQCVNKIALHRCSDGVPQDGMG